MKGFTLIIGIAVFLTGCSFRTSDVQRGAEDRPAVTDVLSILSTPEGGVAHLSSGESCVTPCKLRLRRDANFSVTISKEGYHSQTVAVSNRLEEARTEIAGEEEEESTEPPGPRLRLHPNPVSVKLVKIWRE